MLYDVLELLLNYMQYLYLTVTIAPSVFPTLYSSPFRFLDNVMNTITYSGGVTGNGSDTGKETERVSDLSEQLRTLGVVVPAWLPLDLRMVFFITNILCPIALVLLTALLLGPPQFTGLIYLLCTSVFFMVAGSLLLRMHASGNLPKGAKTLSRLLHDVSVREAIVITVVGSSAVLLLVVFGIVLRCMWSSRRRAEVLERLRCLEHAPRTVEERVAEGLLHPSAAGGRNEEDEEGGEWEREEKLVVVAAEEEEDVRMQRAKAELAYRRMLSRQHEETRALSLPWTLLKAAMVLACLAAAFLFARVPKSKSLEPIQSTPLFFPVAALLFLLAPLLAASLVLGLTHSGRRRLFGIKLWLRHTFLWVSLLVVSFMYAPILRNTINLFPCRLADGSKATDSSTDNASVSWYLSSAEEMEPAVYSLVADPRVPCDGVEGFMSASAVLTAATYALFFLLLYSLVTRQVLRTLDQYPLGDAAAKATRAEKRKRSSSGSGSDKSVGRKKNHAVYYERVRSSQNEAQFLYAPYAYAFRYFRLVVLAQKTVMVIISTVMREGGGMASPWMGFAASLLLHLGLAVVLVVCQPYAAPMEFVVSLALQVMLSLLAAMGLTSALATTTIPAVLWYILTPCLFLVPCAAVITGALLMIRRYSWRTCTARAGACNEIRRLCRSWRAVLTRRLGCGDTTHKRSGCWYEQYASKNAENQIFVPALYFSQAEDGTATSWSSSSSAPASDAMAGASASGWGGVVGNNNAEGPCRSYVCTASPSPVAAEQIVVLAAARGSSSCSSSSPRGVNEPYGNESGDTTARRAKHYWAMLRTAVRFGQLRGSRACEPVDVAHTITSWRAAATSATPTAAPPPPEPSHSLAMRALFVTVASESRWEMSPNLRKDGRRAGGRQQRRACGDNDNPMPSPRVVTPPNQVRREEVFLERVQAFAARQRLLSLYSHYKRHILRQQRAVDCYINARAAQTMRHLLLFLGVVSVVEAAVCVCGMLLVERS